MIISLLTDAPKHNLALMKLSAWHKENGDHVSLNKPLWPADKRYASILFDWNCNNFFADEYAGIGYNFEQLSPQIEALRPDYSLFNLDYSLGYTYRYCPRKCPFCKVWKMEKNKSHKSIWDFHSPNMKKICLLNNNTFSDSRWKETFQEIWDAKLTVIDENGYDLRLLNEEKANTLRKTKFQGYIHYAWDQMQDEANIIRGLKIAPKGHIYVLIGFDTTEEEDIYRCQKIVDYGHDPYIMPFNQSTQEKRFKRFIDSFMWRKFKTIEKAWREYGNL